MDTLVPAETSGKRRGRARDGAAAWDHFSDATAGRPLLLATAERRRCGSASARTRGHCSVADEQCGLTIMKRRGASDQSQFRRAQPSLVVLHSRERSTRSVPPTPACDVMSPFASAPRTLARQRLLHDSPRRSKPGRPTAPPQRRRAARVCDDPSPPRHHPATLRGTRRRARPKAGSGPTAAEPSA